MGIHLVSGHLIDYITKAFDDDHAHSLYKDSFVRKILEKIILPDDFDKDLVEYYIKRSVRNGSWRMLRPESRALLLVVRFWRGLLKSVVLKNVLRKIFIEIELLTLRGKALFYGILLLLKKSINIIYDYIKDPERILIIGLSYLNNPPLYRVYG